MILSILPATIEPSWPYQDARFRPRCQGCGGVMYFRFRRRDAHRNTPRRPRFVCSKCGSWYYVLKMPEVKG